MLNGSRPRHKKVEKISFEELMGAAGMSGFGALLQQQTGNSDLRRRALDLIERLDQQNQTIWALKEPLSRRVDVLGHVLKILTQWRFGTR
jgi:hypothetical protein